MPEGTSTAKFLRAVKYRETDITKVLTKLFRDPEKLATKPKYVGAVTALAEDDALESTGGEWTGVLKGFMEKRIKAHKPIDEGADSEKIKDKILDHIQAWPNNPGEDGDGNRINGKEQLRKVLVAIVQETQAEEDPSIHPVDFFWELTREDKPEYIKIVSANPPKTDIDPEDPNLAGVIHALAADEHVEVTFINPWNRVREEGGNQVEVGIGPEDFDADSVPA